MPCRVLVCFCGFLVSQSLFATDYQSPRTAGLGGAGHAGPILTDAIYMNPAMMPFLNSYTVSFSHTEFSGPDGAEPKGRDQNLSVQDGTNSSFQAGLGYTRKSYGNMVHVGAATRIFEKYGVGVGGKFLFGSPVRESTKDVTISAMGQVTDSIQSALIIDNAINSDSVRQWNQGREIILATKINLQKILLIYFDPHYVPQKADPHFGYELGMELPLMSDLFIRGGVNHDAYQPQVGVYGNGFGFGFGWAFPRMSVDGAMNRTDGPIPSNSWTFSITII